MRLLNNLRLVTKLALPVAIFVAITVGLLALAKTGLDGMARDVQALVEEDAARLKTALTLNGYVNRAALQEKSILADKELDARAGYAARYEEIKQAAFKELDALAALARSSDDRASHDGLKAAVTTYFKLMDQSVAYGLKGYMDDAAMKISNVDGRDARIRAEDALNQQADLSSKALERSSKDAADLASRTSLTLIIAAVLGLSAGIALLGAIIVYGIVRPLGGMTGAMSRLAQGELEVAVTGVERRDEVGELARALQVFKDNALEARRLAAEQAAATDAQVRRAQALDGLTRRFEGNVAALTQGLAAAATEMEATAASMTAVAEQASRQTVTVAGAAQQTSANVQTVAAATEELAISIREIASQVAESSRIAGQAVEEARRTDATVQTLAATAERIGTVIALINNIASQTNLLALNATIEAARAGEGPARASRWWPPRSRSWPARPRRPPTRSRPRSPRSSTPPATRSGRSRASSGRSRRCRASRP